MHSIQIYPKAMQNTNNNFKNNKYWIEPNSDSKVSQKLHPAKTDVNNNQFCLVVQYGFEYYEQPRNKTVRLYLYFISSYTTYLV